MAKIYTTSAYSATTDDQNFSSVNWTATLDGIAQAGFAVIPKLPGVYPVVEFFRGGLTGASSSLDDARCQGLEALSNALLTRTLGERAFVMAPDYPEGDGDRAGGTAGAGVDEFAGAELESCIRAFGSLSEFGKASTSRRAVLGVSRGGVQALKYLRQYKVRTRCVAMWNPFLNMKDWDNLESGTRTSIGAMIPGFTDPAPQSEATLSQSDKAALSERSPLDWVDQLPDVPYFIAHGTEDTTSLRVWIDEFQSRMTAAGRTVQVQRIEGGGHVFAGDALTAVSNATADFLAAHLS